MSKVCIKCLTEIPEDAGFCPHCGQRVEENTEPVLNDEQKNIYQDEEPVANQVDDYESVAEDALEDDAAVILSPEEMKENMKQQMREAKKAIKDAKKELKAQKKSEKREKSTSKATPIGIVAAVVLSVFLVMNLVACFVLSVALGLTGTDISNFAITMGRQALSVDSLLESVETLGSKEMKNLAESLLNEGTDLVIEAGGNSYRVELSEQTLEMIENIVLSDNGPAEMLLESLLKYMDIAAVAVISGIAYVAVILIILVVSIVVALGKRRKALVVPGIIFILVGIVALGLSIIGAMLPEILSASGIDAVFSLDFVATCALVCASSMTVLGVVFLFTGATDTSRE